MKVKIHHEGENILLMLFLIILATGALAYKFFDYKPVAWGLIVLMAILFLLVLNFFRLPRRHFGGDNSDGTAVLSSVDGTVVALEEVYEDEYLHRNVIQLSVFMTVFNEMKGKKVQIEYMDLQYSKPFVRLRQQAQ